MDMSFANQLLAVEYLAARARGERLAPGIYPVPAELDEEIARRKLAALDVQIDALTAEQRSYLGSWRMPEAVAV
jgi:adenosylhomocysteinase